MEVLQFLQTTEQKNIRSFIGMKVKEKLQEYEIKLQERQQMLRDILEFENLQYNKELVQLIKEKVNEQFQKRLDWVNTKLMERVKAEEELLKLKNQQRELENCEEWRLWQSKQLLLDSKKGQLYQIEDKKLRMQKEKEIERMWHEVMERLSREKEFQEIYENKLLKVIEGANQLKNQEINESSKRQQKLECQQSKKEFHEELVGSKAYLHKVESLADSYKPQLSNSNQKALFMEEKFRRDEKRREFLSKTHCKETLKSQIASNFEKKMLEAQHLLKESRLEKEVEDQKILLELEQTERQKLCNTEWHKYYLKSCQNEKQQKLKEENDFEKIYLNTGCVLQQGPKRPYGKNAR